MRKLLALVAALAASISLNATAQPKVAVTDLTYKDTVKEYFFFESAYAKSRASGSTSHRDSDFSSSGRERFSSEDEGGYVKAAGELTRIEYGELRKFTADVKGAMLRSGAFRLVQSKPYTSATPDEQIFDVIARIKNGYYRGADYVLFGTVNTVEWRNDVQPVANTSNSMLLYSLELGVEFSLIDTRTYEVKAAFSAVGEGNDNKIWSSGARLTPNKARVMQAVSRSLAEEAIAQLTEQLQVDASRRPEEGSGRAATESGGRGDNGAERGTVKVYQ